MNERELLQEYLKKPAVQKALKVLRFAEGTERGGEDSYRVMFGGGLAPNLQKHPDKVISSPGGYSSAAAGAYQFLPGTWQSHASALGLKDFGPQSQDLAAVRGIRNRLMPIGGLATLEKEGFSPRVSAALAPEWASLPTESGQSYYGQPVKKLSELQKVYGQDVPQQPSTSSTEQTALSQLAPQQKAKSFLDLFKEQVMLDLLTPRTPKGLSGISGLMGLLGQ